MPKKPARLGLSAAKTRHTKPNPLHRTLHLQHRQHTGKLLPHQHTSYRGLSIILGLAAVVIIGLNVMARATADSLYVYARNPAPVPTTSAVILSPSDGTIVSKSMLDVSGSCPIITPRVIVAIYDNTTFAGSVACASDNMFTLPITLSLGQHILIARTYTITDDAGPDSDPVHVTYIIPPQPTNNKPEANTNTTPTTNSNSAGQSALILTIDEPFIVFGPGKDAIWIGTIGGGTAPYHVHIDWGDGATNNYALTIAGQQQFQHHYRKMQPYNIVVTVHDSAGQSVRQNYAAVTPYVAPVAGGLLSTTSQPPFAGSDLFGIYGAYLILLAVFGYLWIRSHPFAYAKVRTKHTHYRAQGHRR